MMCINCDLICSEKITLDDNNTLNKFYMVVCILSEEYKHKTKYQCLFRNYYLWMFQFEYEPKTFTLLCKSFNEIH